jgi:NAD(P)-dependent dehydrogenase (short-subunit alcohol dehydrogenase family)
MMRLDNPFDLTGQVAVVTGGAGVLCSTLSRALAKCGASIAVLDINLEGADRVAAELRELGVEATGVAVDVLDRSSIETAAEKVMETFGRVDILINGAGGNKPAATTSDELSFFDMPPDALQWVLDLNFVGTLLPTQVFARLMVEGGKGNIVHISSMAAFTPLTKVLAYSAAKAAVSNFTQWLAVHLSQNYEAAIRVNAIAPGFFITEQNRFLLTDEQTGDYTARGRQVVDHTPLARFGDPEELVGAVLWLLSEGASFVHGAVIPIDGGFLAQSGI